MALLLGIETVSALNPGDVEGLYLMLQSTARLKPPA
ncbi:hypothetical protein SAMN04490202_2613 [Pseudomonas reinekei]|uniref:Uncharacterized protein n=1 Tax=Pseudomonas reinekei TaxID=395598 RepID=A0A1H0PD56_PSERE|nr:hypothetical protein SAMN04490202_2613 [Pseudomonas reinekei]